MENSSIFNFLSQGFLSRFAGSMSKAMALVYFNPNSPIIIMNQTKHTSSIAPNYRFVASSVTQRVEADKKKPATDVSQTKTPSFYQEIQHKWARRHSIDSAGGGYEGL
jgi:hypothetical protein